jgi:hypothetical protein
VDAHGSVPIGPAEMGARTLDSRAPRRDQFLIEGNTNEIEHCTRRSKEQVAARETPGVYEG